METNGRKGGRELKKRGGARVKYAFIAGVQSVVKRETKGRGN